MQVDAALELLYYLKSLGEEQGKHFRFFVKTTSVWSLSGDLGTTNKQGCIFAALHLNINRCKSCGVSRPRCSSPAPSLLLLRPSRCLCGSTAVINSGGTSLGDTVGCVRILSSGIMRVEGRVALVCSAVLKKKKTEEAKKSKDFHS